MYWNMNGVGLVTQALNGRITAWFDHRYPRAPDLHQHEIRPEWALGPDVDLDLARPTCLAQLERQTGVPVDPRWLQRWLPTYSIPDPHLLYGACRTWIGRGGRRSRRPHAPLGAGSAAG
ncbi:hypothetical protein [Actinoalloteichus caeruleus]|uniref:hypothetical protein n=1 Tax=Actinoalloteichus cyanogriseus TaxID=2893586 RepID=UPI003BB90DDB